MSVFWTRGYRSEPGRLQMGLVVVRPGWVAFLPLGAPMSAGDQFAHGAALGSGTLAPNALRMDTPWQGRYPILEWWRHGLNVLDAEVGRALAQPDALTITAAEGGIVQKKHLPAVFVSTQMPGLTVRLDQAPPPELVAPFRPAALPLDKRQLRMTLAVISGLLVALGGGCEALIVAVEGDFSIAPIGFVVVFLAFSWALYFLRLREHRADVARAAAPGPDRAYR